MSARVGFVGLGQIGAPMARQLVSWPGGLVVFDLADEPVEALVGAGAVRASSVGELAASCEVVSVMVREASQVVDVVSEAVSAAVPGTVVAIHSTIDVGTAESLARIAEPHGVEVVDAPVSGGAMGARDGRLAVLVGGTEAAVELCRPPFEQWAELVCHFGPVGSGTKAKLARNLMHFVAFAAAGEAQRLAEAAGIDIAELGRVVRHTDAVTGGPGAIMIRSTAAPLPADDPLRPIFEHAAGLGSKDLLLAADLAEEVGVDVPLAHLALELLPAALGLGTALDPGVGTAAGTRAAEEVGLDG